MDGLTFNEDEVINVDENFSSYRFKTQIPHDVIEEAHIPKFEVQTIKPAPVVCHFFFPSSEEGIDGSEREGDLQDPLASSDWSNISDCPTEHITVDDELLALENLPAAAKTSFSIIDPLHIVGPNKIEPEIEIPDIKPTSEQLEEVTRKRKLDCNFKYNEVQKKIKLESDINISNIVLKNLVINIGPKLPLPHCFQIKKEHESTSPETPLHQININKSECGPDEVGSHMKEHLVVKIYRCSKCNHNCTDLALHESHIASCNEVCFKDDFLTSEFKFIKRNGFFPCKTCSFKFKYLTNLITHLKSHSAERGFYCHICKDVLPTVDELRDHYSDLHKGLAKVLSCNICNYSSLFIHHLKDHMIQHNVDKNLHCSKCRRNYDDSDMYNQHVIAVHNNIVKKKSKMKKFVSSEKAGESSNLLKNAGESSNLLENADKENMLLLKSDFRSETNKHSDFYCCNGCTYKFSKFENLIKHKEQHLTVSKPYVCTYCNHKSFSLTNMKQHWRKHSDKPSIRTKKVSCNVCEVVCSTWEHMKRHAINHVYDQLYCRHCRINSEDSESYKTHMNSVHNVLSTENQYSCNKCSFTTLSITISKRHMKKHNSNKNMPIEKIGSIKEKTSYLRNNASSLELSSSEQSNVKSNSFECKKCKIVFNNEKSFKKHNKIHKDQIVHTNTNRETSREEIFKWMFKCNKCSYQCDKIKSLQEHNKLNHIDQEVPFTCTVCGFKSALLSFYAQHIKSHTGNTIYNCRYCPFSSKKVTLFKEHVAGHGFKCCPMCVYKSKGFSMLKGHIDKHHKSGNEPFVCSICPYNTRYKKLLNSHYLRFHPKEYTLKNLPLLTQSFQTYTKKTVKYHTCSFCPFRAFRSHDLKRHIMRHFSNKSSSGKIFKLKQINQVLTQPKVKCDPQQLNNIKPNRKSFTDDATSNNYHYSCSQCSYKKPHRKSVSQHLLRIHNIVGGIRNHMIVKVNGNMSDNKKHVMKDSGSKSKTKEGKPNIIKDRDQMIHKRCKSDTAHSRLMDNCNKCDIHNLSRLAQIEHRKYGHKLFWAKPYSCNKCGMRFTSKTALKRHMKNENKEYLLCKSCNYKSHRRDNWKKHIRLCQKQTSFSKEETDNSTKSPLVKRDLTEFKSEDDETFTCGECDFETMNITLLTMHMFDHSGIPDD
uniref:C2H2-type domain-containing protein n=1 Tax=Cuerna arida TaxID=1464854 RepID=A0A1B6FIV7_9HEMI